MNALYYRDWNPTLKFLGTMNGGSESHTNAYYLPDPETIVFFDLSLLNAYRAERIIRTRPGLTKFYNLITHTHCDHASGVELFAYGVKMFFPGHLTNVITDESIAAEVKLHLDTGGMRKMDGDESYKLLMWKRRRMIQACDGSCEEWETIGPNESVPGEQVRAELVKVTGFTNNRILNVKDLKSCELDYCPVKKPDWFIGTIPTTHGRRLTGASGFMVSAKEKLIIYSGDTETIEPFVECTERMLTARRQMPTELYLDVTTVQSRRHPYFPDVAKRLTELVQTYPGLEIVLMHYNDRALLREMVRSLMPGLSGTRVFLAEKVARKDE